MNIYGVNINCYIFLILTLLNFFLIGIVLSSPDKSRFGQYIKKQGILDPQTLFMPEWDKKELEIFSGILEPKYKIYFESNYKYYGGVPRLLFNFNDDPNFYENKKEKLKIVLEEKGSMISETVKSCQKFDMSSDNINNYMIIHINPEISPIAQTDSSEDIIDNENLQYSFNYRVPKYSFASLYVERQIFTLKANIYISELINLINTGMIDIRKSNDINRFFERVFLYLSPPTNRYYLPSLSNSNIKLTYIQPSKRQVFLTSQTSQMKFEDNVFYIPDSRIFESVDAFFLSEMIIDNDNRSRISTRSTRSTIKKQIDKIYSLHYIQVTTSKDHSVNLKGLQNVEKFFKDNGYNVNFFNLIFVVQNNSSLKKFQPILGKNPSTGLQKSDINQFIFVYDIPIKENLLDKYQKEYQKIIEDTPL